MKTSEEHKAELAASAARFDKLVLLGADELTVVLKGHLLIEEQLLAITRSLLANPRHFDNARLTFSNALHLARAAAGHFNDGHCWAAAGRLNSVRNQIAHQAEPVSSHSLFDEFFAVCEAEPAWSAVHALPRSTFKLRMYISVVWVTFDVLRAVVQVCIQTVPSPLTQIPMNQANDACNQ